MKKINLIVAVDSNSGIGKNGKLPWSFKNEMQYFKETTTKTEDKTKKNAVIMGRTTWESINPKYRPLKNRKNIILTSHENYEFHAATCKSLKEAINLAEKDKEIENIFIIGGGMVFNEAINLCDNLYITEIGKSYECDTFFPEIPSKFRHKKLLKSCKEQSTEIKYYCLSKK